MGDLVPFGGNVSGRRRQRVAVGGVVALVESLAEGGDSVALDPKPCSMEEPMEAADEVGRAEGVAAGAGLRPPRSGGT